jgi:uncharacterized protein
VVAFFGVRPHGFVYPIGVDVAAGALLFGVGMQFAAACPAGALYDIGGFIAMFLTLAGLMAGSVLGDWHWRFWTQQLPSLPPISLAHRLGYGGALPAQLAVFALIAAGAGAVRRRRRPAPPKRPRTDAGPARVVRGTWAPWCWALVLAGLNAATLLIKGSPWGTTGTIALWGSKLAAGLGVPVGAWAYWSGAPGAALRAPVLADAGRAIDLGLILGALLAAGAAGTFALRRPIPWPTALAATVGGTMMGYGAQVSGGCTVGAYFSGVASFSLHGWLWGALAVAGAALGRHLLTLLPLSPLRTDAADW